MKSNKFLSSSAIVTALLASLCCITPVLAVLGGLSGIASAFSFLEPFRLFFAAFTAFILAYAFYNAYRPRKKDEIECACDDDKADTKNIFIHTKSFLWIVAMIAVILIVFPYYSQTFFPESQRGLPADSNHIIKARLEIEGMTCASCEQSVEYALKSEKGILTAESSYKIGIAYVQFDVTKIQPDQLKKAFESKAGYKVKRIQTINEKEK